MRPYNARAVVLAWTAVCLLRVGRVATFMVPIPFNKLEASGPNRFESAACRVARPNLAKASLAALHCSGSQSEASEETSAIADEGSITCAVRVVSYNVLSSDLCEADWHVKCSPQNLNQKNRLVKVMDKLENEVQKDAIICLQEVSTKWAGQLHSFFSERNYHMVHMGYGNKFDGYMGVAMAFPLKTFKLLKCRIERPSDLRRWPSPPKLGFRKRTVQRVTGWWQKLRGIKPPINPTEDAKRRSNQMIMMRLQDRESGVGFLVGTYHMPCQFRVPEVSCTAAECVEEKRQRQRQRQG